MNILLLMMGGSGTRFGNDIPKQYTDVGGRPMFTYILKGYEQHASVDRIVIVSHADWIPFVREWAEKDHITKAKDIIAGGETRSESVKNGLTAAAAYAAPDDVVLIHDATHPYVDGAGVDGVIEGVQQHGGATLGALQYDTCYRIDSDNRVVQVTPRQELISGASPEGFRFGKLYQIYSESTEEEMERMTSAGAIALAHGIEMVAVPARVLNLKVTYPGDMELFRHLVINYFFPGEARE